MPTDHTLLLESLFGISAAFFALGFWIRRCETAPRQWPQVPGTIVTCKIALQPGFKAGRIVTPIIEYEFSHLRRSFRSAHRRFWNFSVGNSLSSQAITSRYPVGSSVTVFVNPRHPLKSVLDYRPSRLFWLPFAFAILFLALFALACFRYFQS